MTEAAAVPGQVHGAGTHRAHKAGALTVVGIGASAGGLKALQAFFDGVPADGGMAYVVIMHLDPDRESRLAQILQSRAHIPVVQVTRSTTLRPDRAYVIPPDRDLAMRGATLRVLKRGHEPLHLPVDLFFGTLAAALGPDAIAVVLSGTGDDGTAGIRQVKEHGGITVAQLPADAGHQGMPLSAIATGQVDLVLPAAGIAAELVRQRRMPPPLHPDGSPEATEAQLGQVFSALRGRTGHDFSRYKRSTVLRRLDRRLRFNGVAALDEYLPLLRADEAESRALVRDLLISVSGFFRDPAAFAALCDAVPALFEGKGPEDFVRVWVPGCATGEEAYSVAMVLAEHASTLEHPPRIQMFATDIDEKGYAWGRDALYTASVVAGIAPERLRRFFTQEVGGFRVRKSLREGMLFAVHNVLSDAPFSRVDLISCRNLLIYLQPEAQARVLETFHYSLRRGGLLFLGASESAGEGGLFVPVAKPQRLYRRDAAPHVGVPRMSSADPRPGGAAPGAGEDDGRPQRFSYGALHLRMLEAYGPPSLVVDEKLEVVHLAGGAGRFLRMGEGQPSRNLIDLVRGDLRMELRTALYQAFEKGLPTTRQVRLEGGGGACVRLEVRPPAEGERGGRFALVVLGEGDAPGADGKPAQPDGSTQQRGVAHLEEELRRTKEQLESISAARDHTVQELQTANEELQSANEEDKAAAEELETSREEIQSINEELTTINQEHQNTIEELKRTNADLQNLIESTEIGTIFLDRELRIRRFTPSVGALFNFVATDQGRPLAHITHRLIYDGLAQDVARVLATQERIEREVSSDEGEWYVVRINPYRSPDDAIDGAVLTFFDISAQKRVEDEMRDARTAAESANLAKGTFMATLSHEFRTPLTGMLGYADILHLDGPLTQAQEHKIGRIKACGWHLAGMIDEILAFSLRDDGRDSIQVERLDARQVARDAKVLVDPMAGAKRLAFVLDLPDAPVELVSDAAKARQILVNLCGNAVKYTERGEIRLRVRAEGERVVFEVRDTGIGIAPEHQARIFDRFWQVDGASTRSFGGMGIGLAAAREFSRLLGGDVEVASEEGRGSTFRAWLPARPAER
ncbi:MAG: cheBR [Gemmatimonadetes bacterium]|nr:cheBR [Gemmatimonadota bacterium]